LTGRNGSRRQALEKFLVAFPDLVAEEFREWTRRFAQKAGTGERPVGSRLADDVYRVDFLPSLEKKMLTNGQAKKDQKDPRENVHDDLNCILPLLQRISILACNGVHPIRVMTVVGDPVDRWQRHASYPLIH
jgi:hypothetical protein